MAARKYYATKTSVTGAVYHRKRTLDCSLLCQHLIRPAQEQALTSRHYRTLSTFLQQIRLDELVGCRDSHQPCIRDRVRTLTAVGTAYAILQLHGDQVLKGDESLKSHLDD